MDTSLINSAQLNWDSNDTPSSSQFDDVYFSKDSGLAESIFVFFEHNQLIQRWRGLPKNDKHQTFTIAETGFGTGLNFLLAWKYWLTTAPPNAQLHFVSAELFPLQKQDIDRAIAQWPELAPLAKQLLQQYPQLIPGYHRCQFEQGRIQLTLMLGDAQEVFSQLEAQVDAWFLDGFAPAKNPTMWQQDLFCAMANLSHSQTTFSTFTAAGLVKRGLQTAGFKTDKVKGFGRKRDMLKGYYSGECSIDQKSNHNKPWFNTASCHLPAHNHEDEEQHALIIGAGLAGSSTAMALAQRGWKVSVLDKACKAAQGASGNKQGILYHKPSIEHSLQSRFYLTGYLFSQNYFHALKDEAWHQTGLIQLANTESARDKQATFINKQAWSHKLVDTISAQDTSNKLAVPYPHSALYFASGGWAEPIKLCEHWLNHPRITCFYNEEVINIAQDPSTKVWHVHSQDRSWQAKHLIIANAFAAKDLMLNNDLPVRPIRGQISYVPSKYLKPLSHVICANNYIGPTLDDGQYSIGATFDLRSMQPDVSHSDHLENLETLHKTIPELFRITPNEIMQAEPNLQGRVSFRCASSDYLPLVGPAPHQEHFLEDYGQLRHDRTLRLTALPRYQQGLYINIGHGSKGLTSCPISAEIIASYINNEPLPVEKDISNALLPARFLIRQLIRNKI